MRLDAPALKEHVDLLELVGRDTHLRKVASTRGGEWAGPCPFCGGRDRFRVQPERRRWWCRQCGGTRWSDAVDYVRRRDDVSFIEACRRLGAWSSELGVHSGRLSAAERVANLLGLQRASVLAEDLEPADAWRAAGLKFVDHCVRVLWSPDGARARAYLHSRGLQGDTLRAWRVGFQPTFGLREPANPWGLDGDTITLPRGIVLPWLVDGVLWHIKVRTSSRDPGRRYLAVRGGHPWLYGADTLVAKQPAILLEGELDTQLVWQAAGDLLGTATLGSARKNVSGRARDRLVNCGPLLEAYDRDTEGRAGADRLRLGLLHALTALPPVGKDPTCFGKPSSRRQMRPRVAAWAAGSKVPPLAWARSRNSWTAGARSRWSVAAD